MSAVLALSGVGAAHPTDRLVPYRASMVSVQRFVTMLLLLAMAPWTQAQVRYTCCLLLELYHPHSHQTTPLAAVVKQLRSTSGLGKATAGNVRQVTTTLPQGADKLTDRLPSM